MTAFNYDKFEQQVVNELNSFDGTGLKELEGLQLQNRVDSKYVFHVNDFINVLESIKNDYRVLEIDGKRIFSYESLYFDTDDYMLYKFHHNGKLNRLKVRFRKYLDSGLTYFEVKYKIKGDRTDKLRLKSDDISRDLTEKELELVKHDYLDTHGLQQKLWVHFKRITLASKKMDERLTIDLNVSFDNFKDKKTFPELIVAEVKQNKSSVLSPIIQKFKLNHYEQIAFSKYSTGIALLEDIKSNAFKPNIIKINKILNGYH